MKKLEFLISKREIPEKNIRNIPKNIYKIIFSELEEINLNPMNKTYKISNDVYLQIKYLTLNIKNKNKNNVIELIWDKKKCFEMKRDFAYLKANDKTIFKEYNSIEEFLDNYSNY